MSEKNWIPACAGMTNVACAGMTNVAGAAMTNVAGAAMTAMLDSSPTLNFQLSTLWLSTKKEGTRWQN